MRQEIEDRLTALRRERGAATLDGKAFNPAAIVAMEHELEALDDAEGEKTRRDREAAERQHDGSQARLRKQLADLEVSRLAAIAEANAAACQLAESIGRAITVSENMARVAYQLTGYSSPIVLQKNTLVSRLCGRLSAVMASIPGHRGRLGGIQWSGGSLYRGGDDWAEAEKALAANHLEHLIGKGTSNGSSSKG